MAWHKVSAWRCEGDSDVHVMFNNAHGLVLDEHEARYLCKLLEHLDAEPPEREPRDPDWIRIDLPSNHSDKTHICISTNSAWHEITLDVAEVLREQLASICK